MNSNDENMLIIRGDQRVADIYLTEFNRLFNHYSFRSSCGETAKRPGNQLERSLLPLSVGLHARSGRSLAKFKLDASGTRNRLDYHLMGSQHVI